MNPHVIIEDVEMAEIEDIGESSHSIVNSSYADNLGSFDNHTDSGYLSLTPQSINTSGSKCRLSKGALSQNKNQKYYWLRSDKSTRHEHRSRLHIIDNSLSTDYEMLDDSFHHDDQKHQLKRLDYKLITHNISKNRNDFRTELREYRTRARRSNLSSNALTPAPNKYVQSLCLTPRSPSIAGSAAVCSYMACEPIEQEIANKLVIVPPHSTPYDNDYNEECMRSSQITCSPKTSKTSPAPIISVRKRCNKLNSNYSAIVHDIKRKRLDFDSQASTHYYQHHTNNIITSDYTGKETLDILTLLGEKTNHPRIITHILSYLKPKDLCAISMVSRSWRRLCLRDVSANARRSRYIICGQNTKENVHMAKTMSPKTKSSNININNNDDNSSNNNNNINNNYSMSPRVKLVKRCHLMDVQNKQVTPSRRRMIPSSSPPVSPSKIKFHSFVKASRTLAPTERLFRCPKCFFACRMNIEKNVGTCTREGCGAEFCTICSSEPHSGACNTPLLSTPTKRKEPLLVVGSKQSKRNLRRL